MPFEFWRTHAVVGSSERGAVVDPQCLNPKLSVNIPDELHMRVKVAVARRRTTVKAFVIEALETALRGPETEPPPKPGEAYRGGTMLSWQPAETDGAAPDQEPRRRR
jgi:plasmid stability protein